MTKNVKNKTGLICEAFSKIAQAGQFGYVSSRCTYYDAGVGAKCVVGVLFSDKTAQVLEELSVLTDSPSAKVVLYKLVNSVVGSLDRLATKSTPTELKEAKKEVSKLIKGNSTTANRNDLYEFLADIQDLHDNVAVRSSVVPFVDLLEEFWYKLLNTFPFLKNSDNFLGLRPKSH